MATERIAAERKTGPPLSDEHFMRLALAEAAAAEWAGEVPVGAVVVAEDGRVVALGRNRVIADNDPTAHCEIVAMREAGRVLGNYRLGGTTLYCTLEPCAMCAGAMIHARIARLVYAAPDPKAGAHISALAVLNHEALNHRIAVTSGLLAEESGAMLREFFRNKRQPAPAADAADASE